MSNSLLRANGSLTTLRKMRRLVLTIASMAVLAVPVLAQHRSSSKSHHNTNRSKQKSVSQGVPRSLPSSAVPQAGGAKLSGSRQELYRIERPSVNQVKPAAPQNVHAAPASSSHLLNSHDQSPPIEFSH